MLNNSVATRKKQLKKHAKQASTLIKHILFAGSQWLCSEELFARPETVAKNAYIWLKMMAETNPK